MILIIALALVVYVWIKLQALEGTTISNKQGTGAEASPSEIQYENNDQSVENSYQVTEPIVIREEQLTPAQKTTLETFKIDTTQIVITPETVSCAEGKVGRERLDEILNGSTPDPFESLELLLCIE